MTALNQEQRKIPCVYMRGGTSKAVFFRREDLPQDESTWDEIFLKVMGTPDVKQIDGMGGTVSSTSKIAVISPSKRPAADVDFTFFQVDIDQPKVAHNVSCGNIGSAVGPYAVDEGLVPAVEPITIVRIYNTNTQKYLEERVRVKNGHACMYGDTEIQGVPGTGSRVDEIFLDPAGACTGKLFPTGQTKDVIAVPGCGQVPVSIVDSGTLVVFVRARDLGLTGSEQQELNSNTGVMNQLERIRGEAAVRLGLVSRWGDARKETPAAPDIGILSEAQAYISLDGKAVAKDEMDLCVRAISLGKIHKAYPITVTVATATALMLPGTLASELVAVPKPEKIRLGHASGVMEVSAQSDGKTIQRVGVIRTARRIMDGNIYIREE